GVASRPFSPQFIHQPTCHPPNPTGGVVPCPQSCLGPSADVPEGATATVTCSAIPWVGEEANYTWYKNSRWLREGPAHSLVLPSVSSADTGSYRCRASGTRGSATSAPLSLHVLCECPLALWGQAPTMQPVRMAFLLFFLLLSLPCSSPGKRMPGFCRAAAAETPQNSDLEPTCSGLGEDSPAGRGGREGVEGV
uniref:Ig-like domain-containing protein n=1 Tax=Otus sunia TaxID=257818 RepID=A0A8C8BP75_9STRI